MDTENYQVFGISAEPARSASVNRARRQNLRVYLADKEGFPPLSREGSLQDQGQVLLKEKVLRKKLSIHLATEQSTPTVNFEGRTGTASGLSCGKINSVSRLPAR